MVEGRSPRCSTRRQIGTLTVESAAGAPSRRGTGPACVFRRIALVIIMALAVGLIPETAAGRPPTKEPGGAPPHRAARHLVPGERVRAESRISPSDRGGRLRLLGGDHVDLQRARTIRDDGSFTVHGHSGLDSLTVNGRFLSRFKAEGFAKSTVFDPSSAAVARPGRHRRWWRSGRSAGGDQGHAGQGHRDAHDLMTREVLVQDEPREQHGDHRHQRGDHRDECQQAA